MKDRVQYRTLWVVRKYAGDEAYAADSPYDVAEIEGNLLLNGGIDEIWNLVCTAGGTKFDATNAYIGVGNSSTAATATQNGLQGTSVLRKGMMSGYPVVGSQMASWKSEFLGTEANFSWQEFCVYNAASGGVALNRKVSNQGTKVSGQIWTVELSITLS